MSNDDDGASIEISDWEVVLTICISIGACWPFDIYMFKLIYASEPNRVRCLSKQWSDPEMEVSHHLLGSCNMNVHVFCLGATCWRIWCRWCSPVSWSKRGLRLWQWTNWSISREPIPSELGLPKRITLAIWWSSDAKSTQSRYFKLARRDTIYVLKESCWHLKYQIL